MSRIAVLMQRRQPLHGPRSESNPLRIDIIGNVFDERAILIEKDSPLRKLSGNNFSFRRDAQRSVSRAPLRIAAKRGVADHGGVQRFDGGADALPGVQVARAADGLPTELAEQGRLPHQVGQTFRQRIGGLRWDQVAGDAVAHRRLNAADGRADHRRAARHRLDGRDAERLVPGRGDKHVGGGVVGPQLGSAAAAGEGHDVVDALGLRRWRGVGRSPASGRGPARAIRRRR